MKTTDRKPMCKCFPLGIMVNQRYEYIEEDEDKNGSLYKAYAWEESSEVNYCPKCGKEYGIYE